MQVRKSRDTRHSLVETRVVLHRARTQRIHSDVDRVVPGGHANEVTYNVDLTHFRHSFQIVVTPKRSWNEAVDGRLFNIQRRQTVADSTGLRTLEDELFVRTDMCCYFGYSARHS